MLEDFSLAEGFHELWKERPEQGLAGRCRDNRDTKYLGRTDESDRVAGKRFGIWNARAGHQLRLMIGEQNCGVVSCELPIALHVCHFI